VIEEGQRGHQIPGTEVEVRALPLNAYIKLMRAATSRRVRLERRLLKPGLTANQSGTQLLHWVENHPGNRSQRADVLSVRRST
jgi:hypothetical protein